MRALIRPLKSDESLMRDYGRGDSVAFDVLYLRHKDRLFNFIYRSCAQHDAVEDIAHDTWIAVIGAAKRYRPGAKFTTWLYQIARNKVIDHWRKRRPDELARGDSDAIAADNVINRSPDQGIEKLELVSALMEALMKLPLEQREAFLLREEGFSQKEIAAITGAGEETVKSRVRYARQQLRVHMGALV